MILQANGNQRKGDVAVLMSDKTDFKTKKVARDKDGHFVTIKGTIHQEDLILINVYAPNLRAPKYIKQLLTDKKEEFDKSTIIVGDF